jgi:hypothetical protein
MLDKGSCGIGDSSPLNHVPNLVIGSFLYLPNAFFADSQHLAHFLQRHGFCAFPQTESHDQDFPLTLQGKVQQLGDETFCPSGSGVRRRIPLVR